MNNKFRIGQKVRIIQDAINPSRIGEIHFITSGGHSHIHPALMGLIFYDLENGITAEELTLEPVYEGDEKSSWSESLWKPHGILTE